MKIDLKLNKIEGFKKRQGPVLFVIMDGYGLRDEKEGNCVRLAKTPNIDFLVKWAKKRNLYTQLKAHGFAVGLTKEEDIGNSEVGHNTLGAGRVFIQGARLVNDAIKNRTIFDTPLWKKLIDVKENNTIHFIGLLSDGNVHSHIDQLFGLLDELARINLKKVRIHTLLDGRDVEPWSASKYIANLEEKLKKLNRDYGVDFRIASGGGRMRVTMDRYESDWNVVKRGWDAHVRGIPEVLAGYRGYFTSAGEAVAAAESWVKQRAALNNNNSNKESSEQYAPSFVIVDKDNKPVGPIVDGDRVINFNFRGDRAIQVSKAFEYTNFDKFERVEFPKVEYAGMLQYDGDLKLPRQFLVPPPQIDRTISEYLCAGGVTQFACAETHKFGHVTYFWNGNNSGYIDEALEGYVEIKSGPSEMIEDHPEMKADDVRYAVIAALESQRYQFLRVNFANPDMVGHTGNIDAGIRAVEVVDRSLGWLKEVITGLDGIMIVSADHGNIEELIGKYRTSHTINPVPFFIWDPQYDNEYEIRNDLILPQLANVTATLLNFLGFEKPEEYFESLVKFKT
jgi:2,3-bisphosphoglycerate-independent phosphoglycerate mutase